MDMQIGRKDQIHPLDQRNVGCACVKGLNAPKINTDQDLKLNALRIVHREPANITHQQWY